VKPALVKKRGRAEGGRGRERGRAIERERESS